MSCCSSAVHRPDESLKLNSARLLSRGRRRGAGFKLADELRLPESTRALAFRGARGYLGERQGRDVIGRALALSIERGRGRDAAILQGNRALADWLYEGPPAALAGCLAGVEFCERRGITQVAL